MYGTGKQEKKGLIYFAMNNSFLIVEVYSLTPYFLLGIYKSVNVPSNASAAMATVSDKVGCG